MRVLRAGACDAVLDFELSNWGTFGCRLWWGTLLSSWRCAPVPAEQAALQLHAEGNLANACTTLERTLAKWLANAVLTYAT